MTVASFDLDVTPVTNAQFLAFTAAYPEWRRDRVSRLLAGPEYLGHWRETDALGSGAEPDQPVVHVSWFAAKAYCKAAGGRLPTWSEWEWVAAADEKSPDARADPVWQQRVLAWYARPGTNRLAPVGKSPPNLYGVKDLHGLVWEWVLDFNSLLVSPDDREAGSPDKDRFCGAGSLNAQDKSNYAVFMRTAYLSSLQPAYTTSNLGFRCAWDRSQETP